MDTTYWGRNFGVMLFKDAISKENLLNTMLKPKQTPPGNWSYASAMNCAKKQIVN